MKISQNYQVCFSGSNNMLPFKYKILITPSLQSWICDDSSPHSPTSRLL